MKKNYLLLITGCFIFASTGYVKSQCASPATLGTAFNMFTKVRNGNSAVAVDNSLNTIVFIHRNNHNLNGGSSGELRYDISTNGGTSWTIDQGVINPQNINYGRYPNVAIYNPTLNTNPNNAYVSYLAPTIASINSTWNGVVTGVKPINGGPATETYNQNGIGTNQIPHSMVKGAPGVFWAIDPLLPSVPTGYNIYKGVWNSSLNDIVWGINYVASPPFNTSWSTYPTLGDYNIAFDPTGQIGYFSFLGHVTPGPSNHALYPVLYKTTNGGSTWTGPIQVDLTKLNCIASNTVSGSNPSTNLEHDLIVDANGIPHIITTVGSALSYQFNYSSWHHMYDITMTQGLWTAYDLGNVNGAAHTWGVGTQAIQAQAPQAARTADGTKVFFTWTDNSNYTLGQTNSTPDLYGKGYDVILNTWTLTKNFTSCNSAIAGKISFPHVATEVLQPSSGVYKLATVIGQPNVTNDLDQQANFYFLDNVTFSTSDFSLTVPPATITIAQAPQVLYCPGSTLNINVVNGGDVLWSNGYTLNPLPITTGSISTYSVLAQANCLIGTASISVVNLSVAAAASAPTVCAQQSAIFSVTGNALSYTWTPGNTGGTTATLVPVNNTVSVMAFGTNSCSMNTVITVSVLPSPAISITGNTAICAGSPELQLTGNGGVSYLWGDGSTGNTYTNTTLNPVTVIGTGANSCTNNAIFNFAVHPSPSVTAWAAQPGICMGQTVMLQSSGATSYSWNGTQVAGNSTVVAPTQNTTYTVTGRNTFSCETTETVDVLVYALPVLTVTLNRPSVCVKEKITLTASGAQSYTWLPLGVLNHSATITPSVAGVRAFTVHMKSSDNCLATGYYSLTVSACVGIDEESLALAISIFPNPATQNITISSDKYKDLIIINELGQVVKKIAFENSMNKEVNIAELPNGIYFITDAMQSLRQPKKLVIAR